MKTRKVNNATINPTRGYSKIMRIRNRQTWFGFSSVSPTSTMKPAGAVKYMTGINKPNRIPINNNPPNDVRSVTSNSLRNVFGRKQR